MATLKAAVIVLASAIFMWWFLQSDTVRPVFVSRPNATYDYIVVGAGSAGAVVASRLSEDKDVTVLLVELGGDDNGHIFIASPGLAPAIQMADPDVVTNYYTEPDTARYRGLKNGQSSWPRGRVLGGSSSINFMLYVRGSRHDFDRWAAYTGDPSWDYSHVLSYFKRSEKITNPELSSSRYHSTSGLLGVTRNSVDSFAGKKIAEGFTELGIPYTEDYNGKSHEGAGPAQQTISDGERSNTGRAFLRPFLQRPNLHISLNSRVQKVIIEKKKAVGVELIKDNKKFIVGANKEIILSAGAIGSPHILMLSGIGPKKHLQELNIPVVADLPVGKNLQDHTFFDTVISLNEGSVQEAPDEPGFLDIIAYKFLRSGPLSKFPAEVNVFTSVTQENKAKNWPELQIMLSSNIFNMGSMFLALMNVDPELVQQYSYRDQISRTLGCTPCPVRPDSRGEIKLRSRDPNDDPMIYPNYYDRQEDVEIMIKGVEICKKLAGTKALSSVGAKFMDNKPLQMCAEYPIESKDYWSCVIKNRPQSVFHPSGTCKMGPDNDTTAVLDSQLRVRGIEGLRVADASIMPYIVSGNTNAASIMIGEKAADLVRGHLLQPNSDV